MKNGIIVLVGNSLAEVEADLNACKVAMSMGKTMGCGGKTIEEATKALYGLAEALGAKVEMPSCPCPCRDKAVIEVDYYEDDDTWYEDEEDDDEYYTEDDVDNIVESMDESDLLDLIAKATKELSKRA